MYNRRLHNVTGGVNGLQRTCVVVVEGETRRRGLETGTWSRLGVETQRDWDLVCTVLRTAHGGEENIVV